MLRGGMARAKGWRKIATATWGWPEDPQVYGKVEVDAVPVIDAARTLRERSGFRVTTTHLVSRAIAVALGENPSINTRLARGRFIPRDSVDIFVIVAAGGGGDLSGVKVRNLDRRTAEDMAREMERRVTAARRNQGELDRAKRMMEVLPPRVLGWALRASAFATSNLQLDLSALGMPRDAFGSAMVSNVGVFGITEGWAPLSPIYRVPLILLVGEVETRPWVVGDRVEPHPVLPIMATIDHRWVDGYGISGLAETFKKYMANPLAYED